MRLAFLAASLVLAPAASSATETAAPPQTHFAALDFLVGHCWQATFENGQRDIQCYERLYDGKFVQSTHTVIGSDPVYGGITLFSWDGKASRIRFHYFTSTGAVSEGHFAKDAAGIVIPERHVGQDGKVIELESRYQQQGEYGYRVVTRENTADGWVERMNLHYRRSDALELPKENATLQHDGGEWRLAWNSNRDGNWEIYRQERDGTPVNLSKRASNEWLWSAHDGMAVGLSNERSEDEAKGWRGILLARDGMRRISADKVGDGFIDCHPRGTPCAVDVNIDGKRRIAWFDASGKRSGLLGDASAEDADPQFSPDGARLLFRSNRTGHWDLWLGDADGGNASALTADPGNDGVPKHEYGGEGPARFSADGKRIVWMRKFPGSGYDVWVMDADGTDAKNLTAAHAGSDAYPSFSPDGRWIAFDSDRDGNNEIYVMDADGGGVRRITFAPGSDLAPLWVRMTPQATP